MLPTLRCWSLYYPTVPSSLLWYEAALSFYQLVYARFIQLQKSIERFLVFSDQVLPKKFSEESLSFSIFSHETDSMLLL